MNEHVGARSRWDDDWTFCRRKHVERVTRDLPRLVTKAGVVGRLAAAGQSLRDRDLEAEALEDAHDGHAGLRMELVDQARREELDDASRRHATGTPESAALHSRSTGD